MRIAFLCKRHYMSKDVILDRYARLYEIPHQLALLGHDVQAWCASYRNDPAGDWTHMAAPGRLRWVSRSMPPSKPHALLTWPHGLRKQVESFHPDVVIAASDIPHVALGARLAKKLGVPFVADLYDNFEGFGQARIPGFVPLLRHAVRHAALVTTTSKPLADFVRTAYRACGEVLSMPSAVDPALFHPRDKPQCRAQLNLPANAVLVGTAGGLLEKRGINVLYEAWQTLSRQNPHVHLILAGPVDKHLPPPSDPRVHYLGLLAHEQVARLFGALDVGVIYLADTPFGRFCFPQKAYEMMASRLPLVGASLGVLPSLLESTPAMLYRPDNAADLARVIEQQLAAPALADVPIKSWAQSVGELARHLERIVN